MTIRTFSIRFIYVSGTSTTTRSPCSLISASTSGVPARTRAGRHIHSEEVEELFKARRREHDQHLRKDLSKKIWKALRKQRRERLDENLGALAEAGSGLSSLKRLLGKTSGVARITSVLDTAGNEQTEESSIGEAFASFYEDLYRDTGAEEMNIPEPESPLLCVSIGEVRKALAKMKNRKTGADDGLVAEMLKTDHQGLLEVICAFFSDLLRGDLEPPERWKAAKLKILFKKGDRSYRKTTGRYRSYPSWLSSLARSSTGELGAKSKAICQRSNLVSDQAEAAPTQCTSCV